MSYSTLFALGWVLDIQVDAAARFVILEIHDIKILSPGLEMNLPVLEARPGKVTAHNTVAGMEANQSGDDLFVEQLRDMSFVLIAEGGGCVLWPVVMEHKFYCPA